MRSGLLLQWRRFRSNNHSLKFYVNKRKVTPTNSILLKHLSNFIIWFGIVQKCGHLTNRAIWLSIVNSNHKTFLQFYCSRIMQFYFRLHHTGKSMHETWISIIVLIRKYFFKNYLHFIFSNITFFYSWKNWNHFWCCC